jgi:hypothetical protein
MKERNIETLWSQPRPGGVAFRPGAGDGTGGTGAPAAAAAGRAGDGQLVPVLPDWTPVGSFADQIHAIRPYALHVPRAVTHFVQHLRASLGGGLAV